MRMGAVIPRYNLEALRNVSMLDDVLGDVRWSPVPFMLDDLPEAVDHAGVMSFAGALARLELSVPFRCCGWVAPVGR